MRETSKCYPLRQARGDFQNYLRGQGIDIGCGDDCLRVESGSVRPWDLSDGDAQLLPGVPEEAFDFVYSSHIRWMLEDAGFNDNFGLADHTALDGLAQLCIIAQRAAKPAPATL